jgi:virginiamycin B lyase
MRKTLFLCLLAITVCGLTVLAQGPPVPTTPRPLPEGPAKTTVERACVTCHPATFITTAQHSPEEWRLLVERMVTDGADVPASEVPVVADYLARAFPEIDVPKAVIIPGSVKVTFKEWTVPTKGSRPHDPLATRDGYLWYTGQYASVLGRVDTSTGEIKEFRTPIPGSGPHGLVEDMAGNIWFTANHRGYIGKLDPKTGKFTEYKLPTEARDPHTPLFDLQGNLWFTIQNANLVGRLNPSNGEVKIVRSPTPGSRPYGMVRDSKGTMYYCEFGAPKIAAIDPDTMEIREWTLPNPGARPRRLAITKDDVIYYADHDRGYLGRLDPKTGAQKEWPSPGGTRSTPYGITVVRDEIWYNEGAVRPNTMVRFDPKTETFLTFAIPAGGGVVRNMMTTPDGNNIAIAESAMNTVGLVMIGK